MTFVTTLRGLAGRLHLRHKFAALGAVGMLMVATPWVGLLREQARELETAMGARATLDPLGGAVAVQRALNGHRLTAHQVLRGQSELEGTRLGQQNDVDAKVEYLAQTLQLGRHAAALEEHQALRTDWISLRARILARRLGADDSDEAHRLLVEQTLQIIDLLPDSMPWAAPGSAAPAAQRMLAAHLLPRLEATLAELVRAQSMGQATAADDLARRVRHLALLAAAAGPEEAPARRGFERALGELLAARGVAPTSAPAATADPAPATAAAAESARAALAAARSWSDAERGAWSQRLEGTIEARRAALARSQALAAGSLALWLALLAWMWPRRPRLGLADTHPPALDEAQRGAESRDPTRRLLRRLRDAAPDTESPPLR